jgi:hypothetical protein
MLVLYPETFVNLFITFNSFLMDSLVFLHIKSCHLQSETMAAMFYKVTMNTELVGTEVMVLGEIKG